MPLRGVASTLLWIVLETAAGAARAGPTPCDGPAPMGSPSARAASLVDRADACKEKGYFTKALERLTDARALVQDDPEARALIDEQMAIVEEHLEHYTRARKGHVEALREGLPPVPVSDGRSAPESAQDRSQVILAELALMTLDLDADSVCVRVDGRPLEPDPSLPSMLLAGTAAPDLGCVLARGRHSLLLDPGEPHVFSLLRPRAEPSSFEISLRVGRRDGRRVSVEQGDLAFAGFLIAGFGAGIFLGGTTFGLVAMDKHDQAQDPHLCYANRCSRRGLDLHAEARDWGNEATIAMSGGALVMAAGLLMAVLGKDTFRMSPLLPNLEVALSPAPGGLVVAAWGDF
jgi:hypothetical protein